MMGLLSGLASCAQWNHAPGYAARASMEKHELRVVTGRFCHFGACDKHGPAGRVRFSKVHFVEVNGARSETSFDVEYDGAFAQCAQASDRAQPFVCSISAVGGDAYELALGAGCTSGMVAAHDPTRGAWAIQTDTVRIAGHVAPAREVALLDPDGVAAFANAYGVDNLDVFTRPGTPLANTQLLAVVSLQAFLQLDGTPPECLTSG